MKEPIALLAALAEAVWRRQADAFDWPVKASDRAGASRVHPLIAVETSRLFGEPPRAVVADAEPTVHAWQWMASRRTAHANESAPSTERGHPEPRRAWVPWTPRR